MGLTVKGLKIGLGGETYGALSLKKASFFNLIGRCPNVLDQAVVAQIFFYLILFIYGYNFMY